MTTSWSWLRECQECAKLSSRQKVATLKNLKYILICWTLFWLLHDSVCYFIVLMSSLLFCNVENSKKIKKNSGMRCPNFWLVLCMCAYIYIHILLICPRLSLNHPCGFVSSWYSIRRGLAAREEPSSILTLGYADARSCKRAVLVKWLNNMYSGAKKYLVSHKLCKFSHLKRWQRPVIFIIGTLQLWLTKWEEKKKWIYLQIMVENKY